MSKGPALLAHAAHECGSQHPVPARPYLFHTLPPSLLQVFLKLGVFITLWLISYLQTCLHPEMYSSRCFPTQPRLCCLRSGDSPQWGSLSPGPSSRNWEPRPARTSCTDGKCTFRTRINCFTYWVLFSKFKRRVDYKTTEILITEVLKLSPYNLISLHLISTPAWSTIYHCEAHFPIYFASFQSLHHKEFFRTSVYSCSLSRMPVQM